MANVVFTEPAEYDLLDIEYYIFVDLCNPQAAQRISDGILDAAEKPATVGVRGRQTPVVNKRPGTDARNRPPDPPANCPHCG